LLEALVLLASNPYFPKCIISDIDGDVCLLSLYAFFHINHTMQCISVFHGT
jgi:hypothetical protein